jgi:hypothetical protein
VIEHQQYRKVEDKGYVLKAGGKMGEMGGKGLRESNGRGLTDQSKIYSQWGYIEKPL